MLFEESSFYVWLPQIAIDEDENDEVHVRVTEKEKFKFKKSAAFYFSPEKTRFLVEPEKGFKVNDRELSKCKDILSEHYDELLEKWQAANGGLKFK